MFAWVRRVSFVAGKAEGRSSTWRYSKDDNAASDEEGRRTRAKVSGHGTSGFRSILIATAT